MVCDGPFILAAVGLDFEADIAAAPGVIAVRCPPAPASGAILHAAVAQGCRGIISFGIAGGLDARLKPGDGIVASTVIGGDQVWAADEMWSEILMQRIPNARLGTLYGSDTVIATVEEKKALHESGAAAVDMESHIAATVAAQSRIPFAAYRVIADSAKDPLPQSVLAGRRSDGSVDAKLVLGRAMRNPGDFVPLIRLALATWSARRGLLRARRMLGPAFGLGDFL